MAHTGQELDWAISVGIIKDFNPTTQGFKCVACDKVGVEVMSHLGSKEHKNSLWWEILNQPSPDRRLIDVLPEVIRTAKVNNEVEAVDKTVFTYKCNICPGKKPFSGIVPLEGHLSGKEHEKTKRNSAPPPVFSPPQPQPMFQSLLQPMPRAQPQPQPQPQPVFQPLPQPQPMPQPQPQPQPQPRLQPVFQPQPQPRLQPVFQPQPQPMPPQQQFTPLEPDNVGNRDLFPEAQQAIDKKIVVRNGAFFSCNVCGVNLTGIQPLRQHLTSEKHKKKVQALGLGMASPAIDPLQFSRLSLNAQTDRQLSSDSRSVHSPSESNSSTSDQTDDVHTWEVRMASVPEPSTRNTYRNLSKPRGLVLIFNYHVSTGERPGACRDSLNLKTLFTLMGYHVSLNEDLTLEKTLTTLESTQKDPKLQFYDSFILIIMSHGREDLLFTTNSGMDDNYSCLNLKDVRSYFLDKACPSLEGKPKIFLANFCRGEVREQQRPLDSDSFKLQEAPKDMITIYSCINTFQSLRDPVKGTLFVQALCEVLAEHAHDTELNGLYIKLYNTMHRKQGTTPEQQNYAFKKFFFNPTNN